MHLQPVKTEETSMYRQEADQQSLSDEELTVRPGPAEVAEALEALKGPHAEAVVRALEGRVTEGL